MTIGFIFFIFVLFIFALFFSSQFFNIFRHGSAPFLSTDSSTLKKIINNTRIDDKDIVYELGCGKASLLFLLDKTYPHARLYGIEYSFLPFFLASTKKYLLKNKNLKIIKQNFFLIDLSKANIIYCYLSPSSMKKLAKKFKDECVPGAQIISNSFQIPNWTAKKTIISKNKKIYFYKI